MNREWGGKGIGRAEGEERKRNAGEIKLQQKAGERKKSPKKAARCHYDRLSFLSEGEEKDCVRRIGQEGRSLRDAIDHSGSPFPREMIQREAKGSSEVEWEIRVEVHSPLRSTDDRGGREQRSRLGH